MKVIPLKYDFCAKEVFDNEIVRKHFLSDVLGIPLESIKSARIINPFLWKRYKSQKLGILDIKLELNDDTKIYLTPIKSAVKYRASRSRKAAKFNMWLCA